MKARVLIGSSLLILALLAVVAGPAVPALAKNAPITCAIQTSKGTYLTAVGGGGRTTDAIHSDAKKIGGWEKFTLIDMGEGNSEYALQTVNGHYLTAVSGGGRISDVIHSDATQVQGWERFKLWGLGGSTYTIQTSKGNYLTAVGGGGRITDVIHSDATQAQGWEKFTLICPV